MAGNEIHDATMISLQMREKPGPYWYQTGDLADKSGADTDQSPRPT